MDKQQKQERRTPSDWPSSVMRWLAASQRFRNLLGRESQTSFASRDMCCRAVAYVETRMRSDLTSSAGAVGIFQFKPSSASQIMRRWLACYQDDRWRLRYLLPKECEIAMRQKYDNHAVVGSDNGNVIMPDVLRDDMVQFAVMQCFLDIVDFDCTSFSSEEVLRVGAIHHHGLALCNLKQGWRRSLSDGDVVYVRRIADALTYE